MAPGDDASGRRSQASGSARDCALASECVDPVTLVREQYRRSCVPQLALAYAAALPPAANAGPAGTVSGGVPPGSAAGAAAAAQSGAGDAAAAGTVGTAVVYGSASAVASTAGSAVQLALRTASASCSLECPACGRASPRLLLPQSVADWLLEAAGPGSLVSSADFASYDGADGGPSGKVWASRALSDTLQSGTGVAHVLQAVLARRGEALPFPTDVLRAGSAPPLRLLNWTLLAPLLAAFDITLSDDTKTLIVAGEREPLATLLAEMKARVGAAGGALSSEAAAKAEAAGIDAEKRLTAEKAAERKELLADTVSQAIGLYSIVMACLLALFVEQECGPNARNPEVHQCTLDDDFNSIFEQAVLGVNFGCLLVFVAANVIFWLREKFIIEHFQEDADQPEDALPEEIAAYPAFLARLRAHNTRSYYAAELMFCALIMNFGISAVLILDKHYAGRTSVVGLLSNTFLCLSTVYGYRSVAKQCCDTDMATSLFESEQKNANAIADDKKFMPGVYDVEGTTTTTAAAARVVAEAPSPKLSARSGSLAGSSRRGRGRGGPPPPPPRELERRGRKS